MAATTALLAIGAGASLAGGAASFVQGRNEAKRLKALAEVDANEARLRASKLKSAQRVAFAKGGVDLQEGTPLEVFAEAAEQGELDALRRRSRIRRQGQEAEAQGTLGLIGGIGQAATTILGGVQPRARSTRAR